MKSESEIFLQEKGPTNSRIVELQKEIGAQQRQHEKVLVCECFGMCVWERERTTKGEREKDGERESKREREREEKKERERKRKGEANIDRNRETKRQRDKETKRQRDRETERRSDNVVCAHMYA